VPGFACKNGGWFADCARQVPCEYCRLGNCRNAATWALHPSLNCMCPDGTSGFDCTAIDNAALCPAGTVHNIGFVGALSSAQAGVVWCAVNARERVWIETERGCGMQTSRIHGRWRARCSPF
jgi:hypothetical protein